MASHSTTPRFSVLQLRFSSGLGARHAEPYHVFVHMKMSPRMSLILGGAGLSRTMEDTTL
jgi:hypothetical protein